MEVDMSTANLLSLYTSIDETTGHIENTRTVIVTHQVNEPGHMVLMDNVLFTLYISIPKSIEPGRLRRFMLNSYAFVHFTNPFESNDDVKKGSAVTASTNKMVSPDVITLLTSVDARNDAHFSKFMNARKKKEHRDNDEYNEYEEDEEEEEEVSPCHFDNDMDIMIGLETDCTPLKSVFNAKDRKKKFPKQKQYKVVFNNHMMIHYFVNRFLNKPVQLKGEPSPFNVHVMEYEKDAHNVKSVKPIAKIFKGLSTHYVEGQLYQFSAARSSVRLRYDAPITINHGLLLPSSLDSTYYTSQQYANTIENMLKTTKPMSSKFTMSYQCFYIDLYTLHDTCLISIVDYTDRQLQIQKQPCVPKSSLKRKEPPVISKKNMSLHANNTRLDSFIIGGKPLNKSDGTDGHHVYKKLKLTK